MVFPGVEPVDAAEALREGVFVRRVSGSTGRIARADGVPALPD